MSFSNKLGIHILLFLIATFIACTDNDIQENNNNLPPKDEPTPPQEEAEEHLFDILNLDWSYLIQDIEKTEKLIFLVLVFSLSMTFFFVLFWRVMEEISRRKMQVNLKRLLAGKEVVSFADPDLDASFKSLSGKLNLLTEAVQKAENQSLVKEEAIIEKERKRIARDLHDTVSQELFAAHMILSGISQQALKLDREKMQTQLQSVAAILETAQKDLRVLLLHLRPVELEEKSFIEGIQIL